MNVKVDEGLDVIYNIRISELDKLRNAVEDYFSNSLRYGSADENTVFFLGHAPQDKLFSRCTSVSGLQVLSPLVRGDPYHVNLSTEAVTKLDMDRELRARVPGGMKLFIFIDKEGGN